MTLLIYIVDDHTIRFYHEPTPADLLAERINSGLTSLDPGLIPGCRWKAVAQGDVVTAAPVPVQDGQASHPEMPDLTVREREVLSGLAAGLTFKLISARLGIHPQTAAEYARTARSKLRAATRQEAVLRAAALGLLHRIQDE